MSRAIVSPMIKDAVNEVCEKSGLSTRFQALGQTDSKAITFSLAKPPKGIEADYSSNVAILLSPFLKRSPFETADFLAGPIRKKDAGKVIDKIGTSPNGFLNFVLSDDFLKKTLDEIRVRKESFGKKSRPESGKILVEFVSANPTGPLHIGHGRGAALGDSLARIYRQSGYPVETEYYVNDVGVQMNILADSVRVRFLGLQGKEAAFPENGYQGQYIERIAKSMNEKGESDFDRFPRETILDWIRKDLEEFRVAFDHWFGESSLYKEKKVEGALKILQAKQSLVEKEGALWFKGPGPDSEEKERDKERVLRKSDGKYTYFASDIAYHKDKFERGFEKCIDIWGHDHHGYVARVESALSALGIPKDALKILLYQLVSLKRGGKRVAMSTRSGEFVTLKEILDEVGPDACRFFFAMRNPNSQLLFDVDLAKKQSNENPVFYVQYVHARISSIFKEAEKRGIKIESAGAGNVWNGIPFEKEERNLARKLVFFEDVLESSLQFSSPHLVAGYLIELSTDFHRFYDTCRVLDAEPALRAARLGLLSAVQIIVRLGLSLLGVSAPEKM